MARNGYKVTVYLDDNPNSITYMQTYEERVEDTEKCPISTDDLILISNECEIGISGGYTGYRLLQYYNRTTHEYVYVRELDAECEESSTEEQWVNSGSPYCETTEQGLNTGYMLQLQVQMNKILPNYGQTRYQRYKSPECGGNNCPVWELVSKQCHISVANCAATFDGTADITEIDVNPLSMTYNQTRTVNKQDSDCENCTSTSFNWVLVGDMCGDDSLLCDNGIQETSTNSYTVHRKYKTIGSAAPVPMDEYQVVLKTEDDEDCGYIRPQYEMRRMNGQYICDYETYTKYEKWCQYVTYDSGVTWSLSVPEVCERGNVIAYDSYDCGKPMYRWIPNGEFTCVDNGDDGKIVYWDSNSVMVSAYTCDETDYINSSHVSAMTSVSSGVTSPDGYKDCYQIGDCVTTINGLNSLDDKIWLGNYTEKINSGLQSYERTSLDIPSRVNYIGDVFARYTSHWSPSLRTMVLHPMTPPTLSGNTSLPPTLTGTWAYDCAIFVPNESYQAYCESPSWSGHTNYIKPMNNDSDSYKAIVRYESDFSTWSWYVPDGESADTIDTCEAAYGSANIVSITISDKVRTIRDWAFYRPENYTSFGAKQLDLGNGVQTIEPLAFKDSQFTDIYIPSSVRTIGYEAFGSGALTSLTIANGVQTIGNYAFQGHKLSGTIEIPDSVQIIGDSAFKGNQYVSNVEHIIIGSGCTEIYNSAFYQNKTNNVCPLKTVTVKALTPPRIYGSGSDYCGQYNTVFSSFYNKKVGSNYCNYPYGNYTIYVPCEVYEDYLEDPYWSYFLKDGCTIEPYGCSEIEETIAVLHQTDGTDININKPINAQKILKGSDISPYISTTSSITVNSNCIKIQNLELYESGTLSEVTFNSVTPPTFENFVNWGVTLYVPCAGATAYYEVLNEHDFVHMINEDCIEEIRILETGYICSEGDRYYTYKKQMKIDGEWYDYIPITETTASTPSGQCIPSYTVTLNNWTSLVDGTYYVPSLSETGDTSMIINLEDVSSITITYRVGGSYGRQNYIQLYELDSDDNVKCSSQSASSPSSSVCIYDNLPMGRHTIKVNYHIGNSSATEINRYITIGGYS